MNSNRKVAIWVGIFILLAYVVLVNTLTDSKLLVTSLEVISGLAVIGIAVLLFPILKTFNKKLTKWYLSLKFVEGLLMVVAGFLFLSLSLAARDSIYLVHTYVFIVSAFMLYWLLYQSRIVPRYISIWGMIAIIILLIVNSIEVAGVNSIILTSLYAPIILNEVYLAGFLIFKGFKISRY